MKIEDYALMSDCRSAALVGINGSIDWLCLPRFDSGACFAALLGGAEHGRWQLRPSAEIRATRRRYRDGTLVLETEFECDGGAARLVDFMPLRSDVADVVRIVEGIRGEVPMRMDLTLRTDYGSIIPWVQRVDGGLIAIAGPDLLRLRAPVPLTNENFATCAAFTVSEGQRLAFDLTWSLSHRAQPVPLDTDEALAATVEFWQEWSGRCTFQGEWRDAVVQSALVLKALTHAGTGGMVAAPTTSLPEQLGGVRNWDYRYCWLRDATFTLLALMHAGYHDEARAWREWLLRAAAGQPSQINIMYGLAGERRLIEFELPHLPGYEDSRPVRIGNGAHHQFQLDVFGEVMDALHQSRRVGLDGQAATGWRIENALMEFLESNWDRPDSGIWEVRGPMRHFTHSKVMAWVAMDRAVKSAEFGLTGPVDRWRALRDQIHTDVCRQGFNADLGSFVQSYGSTLLDASLLMVPLVGFLPPEDPRVQGTVNAVLERLTHDGFVARYETTPEVDGLPPGEGTFLLCTFWLADNLALMGRVEDARKIFEGVLAVRNDLGLLAESYDVDARRLVGNYPQAFSHIGLINTAGNLSRRHGPAEDRRST